MIQTSGEITDTEVREKSPVLQAGTITLQFDK